jgi:HAD superfamily hydrolase (TIGR01484 family)
MQPLSALSAAARRAIRGVFTDIDDTLSTRGKITAEAYAAMARLRSAGLLVVPITGRPAGWCDHIARMWPVDAVVGENGALYMAYDEKARKLKKRYVAGEADRRAARERLAAIAATILREVPGSALASDQPYREADLAIDYCEDVAPLAQPEIDRIVTLMRTEGLTVRVSSVHVNGWFGAYDKLATTRAMMTEQFGVDLDAAREHYAFVGDSPNDASMFDFFPCSVGVANVRLLLDRIATPPKYVTLAEAGAGFAELVDCLLSAR